MKILSDSCNSYFYIHIDFFKLEVQVLLFNSKQAKNKQPIIFSSIDILKNTWKIKWMTQDVHYHLK